MRSLNDFRWITSIVVFSRLRLVFSIFLLVVFHLPPLHSTSATRLGDIDWLDNGWPIDLNGNTGVGGICGS